jgi:hypothetical protein
MSKNPVLFPSVCIDNFYQDPMAVRNLALAQGFNGPDNAIGKYPGVRSHMIYEIDPQFFDNFCKKILSTFIDLSMCNYSQWNIESYFQLIYPDSDPDLNKAWVHDDSPNIFGGVIYLDPAADPDTGTSIGEIDFSNIDPKQFETNQEIRKQFYKGELTSSVDIDEYKRLINLNNDCYIVTAEFKNKFNRAVCFDGNQTHKANLGTNTNPRLTQVFFVRSIDAASHPPMVRINQFPEFEN